MLVLIYVILIHSLQMFMTSFLLFCSCKEIFLFSYTDSWFLKESCYFQNVVMSALSLARFQEVCCVVHQ